MRTRCPYCDELVEIADAQWQGRDQLRAGDGRVVFQAARVVLELVSHPCRWGPSSEGGKPEAASPRPPAEHRPEPAPDETGPNPTQARY